ncbi:MAG: ribonuclease J [Acidimicrobiaceae bacterium]|jgi:ribonuclease J|nr:ribonuclease J [Acidimicrobiaceae bacterium]
MTNEVTITFLGGLGDIGRNCAAIETDDALLLLDCGQLFASEEEPGVDSILPDVDYLFERKDKIIGCLVTHGHEDHIGAIAQVLDRGLEFPIYGSAFTLGLVRYRCDERNVMGRTKLIEVADNETVQIGPFSVEFLAVTHSVPGGLISAITTPQGLVLHSSDFKLDPHPIDGRRTNLPRIGALAEDPGIRLLLADSTNSDAPGSSASESSMGAPLAEVFRSNQGRRVITACFASHMHRVQQIADAALEDGRKIATLGLSMKKNVALARSLGLLKIPDAAFFDIEEIGDFEPGELCIISTGSQGEERSSLATAAKGGNRWITIHDTDTVILSSHPIPGNEARVSNMMNDLIKRGAEVVHSGLVEIHTSGHGKRDELTTLHTVASPEWFVPVHGEYRHLVAHQLLAQSLGLAADHTLLAQDGDQVVLADDGLSLRHGVTPGAHQMLNGRFLGPDRGVIGQRKIIGQHGFVSVTAVVDFAQAKQVCDPWVECRGWLDGEDGDAIEAEIVRLVGVAIDAELENKKWDRASLMRKARRATGTCVNVRSQRRPMIIPVIIDI